MSNEEAVIISPRGSLLEPPTFSGSTTILLKQIIDSLECKYKNGIVVAEEGKIIGTVLNAQHVQLLKRIVESCLEIVQAEVDGKVYKCATADDIARTLIIRAHAALNPDGMSPNSLYSYYEDAND